jgi:beta-glucoside PTS system EIICBA component
VVLFNYSSSVIPIIFGIWVLSKLEKFLEKVISEKVSSFFVPFFSLLIVVPLVYLVIVPIGCYIGQGVASGFTFVYSVNPIVVVENGKNRRQRV